MVAVGAMVLALLAAVWAIHNRGRTYPNASHQLPIVHLALPAAEPGLTAPTVTTDGTRFVKGGKPTVLQGYDLSVTGQSVYKNAAELNANFARITIAWSQVEPTKPTGDPSHLVHHWDSALLTELDQEVAGLGAQGIQVLIDFHQFHWSPYYAQLECKTGVAACHATGVPTWFYAGRYPQTKEGESAAKADFWDSERKTSLFYYAAFAEMMARRYGHDPNVIGYEIFNEPHPGHLPDSTSTTNAILAWQAQIYKVMHAVDPQRTMFVMCRGGAEGVGTADLDQFGADPKIALDFHDYYNGAPGTGFDDAGDNWVPSWSATHNQDLDPLKGYQGTQAAQNAVLQVPIDASRKAGIPLLVGEWGIHKDDPHADVYTSQMLAAFAQNDLSWARWVLAPGHGFNLLDPIRPHAPSSQAMQVANGITHS